MNIWVFFSKSSRNFISKINKNDIAGDKTAYFAINSTFKMTHTIFHFANFWQDILIPIKIDMEFEGRKYKDIIMWNLNEPFLTPEVFSKMVSEENNLSQYFESHMIQ